MRGLNSVDDKKVEMRKGQKGNAPLRKFLGGGRSDTDLPLATSLPSTSGSYTAFLGLYHCSFKRVFDHLERNHALTGGLVCLA